jgi:hypothetical protein
MKPAKLNPFIDMGIAVEGHFQLFFGQQVIVFYIFIYILL